MGFQATMFGSPREQGGAKARHAGQSFESPSREWWPLETGSVLLAIDPSIARCGYALLLKTTRDPIRLDSGIIYPRGDDEHSRFDDLAQQLASKARPIRFNGETHIVSDAVVEIPRGGGKPGMSMLWYARAVGVCEAACYFAGLGVNRVGVNDWKGREKKSRTAAIVRAIFKYEPRDANEADAIGLGLWLCAQE